MEAGLSNRADDLLHLLQLSDSSFPTGAFAHSYGLETLVQDNQLGLGLENPAAERERCLSHFVATRLANDLARSDLPVFFAAYRLAAQGEVAQLGYLNRVANSLRPVREWREANSRAGRRMLVAVLDFASAPLIADLLQREQIKDDGCQLCVAFAVTACTLGCDATAAAQAYAFNFSSGQLAAAVRLGVVGQRGVQRILHQLKPCIRAAVLQGQRIPLEHAGASLPFIELAGMHHETATERLFAS